MVTIITYEKVSIAVVEGAVLHGSVAQVDMDGDAVPGARVARAAHRVQTRHEVHSG